ncbi:hypothetical protein Bpfe_004102 [Biomphalaria pfeifferi]|uniref:Uncharacterized protein n=1 Tax=Biomphalaria pfeifferi TaxID=112525 RepID=A0AAD8C5H2_BIOPF|nr:hypothetical protein Bpfe_004102 [Biomphalaria pfeifferi]
MLSASFFTLGTLLSDLGVSPYLPIILAIPAPCPRSEFSWASGLTLGACRGASGRDFGLWSSKFILPPLLTSTVSSASCLTRGLGRGDGALLP